MLDAVGYEVIRLHRTHFMGKTLEGLERPGQWKRLSAREQQDIEYAVQRAMEKSSFESGTNTT
jgi:16S rRNA U516 pseudouridylate synthase RsuA-like enzyme